MPALVTLLVPLSLAAFLRSRELEALPSPRELGALGALVAVAYAWGVTVYATQPPALFV